MGEFSHLWDFLTSLTGSPSDVEPAELSVHLQTFRDRFLHHLEYKGPNQASRQQVESLLVNTPKYGEQRLDAEPDKRLALQLSATLNLDEVQCVQYLIQAYDERGSFSAESAAGLYLAERQSAARCLMLLLSEAVQHAMSPQLSPSHPYVPLLHDYVMGLLVERAPAPAGQNGAPVLVTRLVEVLKDTSLEVHASSDLQQVRDEAGLPVSRAVLLQLERRMVAKSLLYCLVLDQRVGPGLTGGLLDLCTQHAARIKPGVVPDVFQQELGGLLLLSGVLALTPQEERGTQETSELQALLAAQDVRTKILPPGSRPPGGPATPPNTPSPIPPALAGGNTVLRLCWGVLGASVGTQASQAEEARKLLGEVSANASITHLLTVLRACLGVQDDSSHQEVVVACAYRLLGQALQADAKMDGPMYKSLTDRLMSCVKRIGGGGLAFAPLPADDPAARYDHLGSVLALLAAVFGVAPRLWLSPDAGFAGGEPQRLVEATITRAVTHDAMKVSPELRIPFFEMMASLAAGEYGVALVLRQFGEMARLPAFEVLTWRKLFATVVEYCVRYNTVLEEMARAGGGAGVPALMLRGQEERLMNVHEAGILVAALNLLRQVVEAGSLPDVRGFLEGLERELTPLLSGYPLTEPLFQLMCHPVPNTVKAALDQVLCSIAHRFSDTIGPRLLDRLVQCAAVAAGAPMVPGVPRLDLVTQLNEIEARKEEYPETIAFVNLLNSLTASALLRGDKAPGGAAVAPAAAAAVAGGVLLQGAVASATSSGLGLSHFTGFVVQHVLAHLWQRGYRYPDQKWSLAAVSLQHLQLMMEVAARSGVPPAAPNESQAPGWAVMHDLLASGPSLQALLQVLGPGFEEINSQSLLPGPQDSSAFDANINGGLSPSESAPITALPKDTLTSRQAAVLAALRVVNKALQLDTQFVADTGRVMAGPRYQTLDQLMLGGLGSERGDGGGLARAVLGGMGVPGGAQLLAILLQYVCYQDCDEIQVEALRLALELSARHPNLVELLPSAPDADADNNPRLVLRRGVAVVLRESVFNPAVCDNLDEVMAQLEAQGLPGASANKPSCDVRAALVLRLLLSNVAVAAQPSLAHLLMGYDSEPSMQGVEDSLLLPRAEYSCLTVIDKALCHQACGLSVSKPQLYASMLALLHHLARHPPSSTPMLEFLTPKESQLLAVLRNVLLQPLPPPAQVMEAAAAMHQVSWITRLMALLLLRLEHAESIQTLLADMLLPQEAGPLNAPTAGGVSGSTLLSVLQALATVKLQEPTLADLPADIRRLQQDMSVDDISVEALLLQPHVQERLGVLMQNESGDVLFDVPKLYSLLMQRYEQHLLRSGQPAGGAHEAATETIRATLKYVQQYNAYALLSGAQAAALEGWLQLTEVTFTRQYSHLTAVLPPDGGATSPADAVYGVLLASLQTTGLLLSGPSSAGGAALAAMLVNVGRVLLSKLQELGVVNVSLGQASDPLVRVRTPGKCHALLRELLELLDKARRAQPVRVQLYAALLQYLQFCRGSKMSSCTPLVLQAVMEGQSRTAPLAITDGYTNGDVSAGSQDQQAATVLVARLDAAQEAIEQGNAALINAQGPLLVDVAARDALDGGGPQLQQAVTLQLLAALVATSTITADASSLSQASGSGTLVGSLYQHAIPQALLQGLANVPPTLLVNLSRASRRGVLVLEAQLALLLALAQAGPSAASRQLSAQALFALQPLQALTGCRAVDLEPEEPGNLLARGTSHMDSLRQRLQHLLPPVLRLVLTLQASLPDSSSVRQDTRLFVGAHFRALDRVLREAASGGAGDWSPGESELEQAELVTSLLSRLVPVWEDMGPVHGEGLRAALFRLASAFCCLDTKSGSPIVRSLHASGATANGSTGPGGIKNTGNNRAALIGRASRVASLRAALARYLRDTVAHAPPPSRGDHANGNAAAAASSYSGYGVPFRALGNSTRPDVDPVTNGPTLMMVRDMAEQACLDAAGAVEELEELLSLLQAPDHQLDDRTCVQKLLDYGPPGSVAAAAAAAAAGPGARAQEDGQQGQALTAFVGGLHARRKLVRHYTAMAASQLDNLLGKALFVLENSLAVVVTHFLRYLQCAIPELSPGVPGLANGSQYGGGGGEEMLMAAAASSQHASVVPEPHLLGSPADLTYLATRLQETCLKAEDLLGSATRLGRPEGGRGGGRGEGPLVGLAGSRHVERLTGVDLMVRTVKAYCAKL